jgi:hypothetical protein
MSKHTPSPWKIDLKSRNSLGVAQKIIFVEHPHLKNHQVPVAYVFGGNTKSIEEAEANAQLMIAAPELLEALKAFINICDNGNPIELVNEIGALIEPARQAIAKAEGA